MNNQNMVYFKDLFKEYKGSKLNHKLPILLGKDEKGKSQFADLSKLGHILMGGSTGSGKSIFEENVILTLMSLFSPDELRLILVDMKRVEFPYFYKKSPYLLTPVIVEGEKVITALGWLKDEREKRVEPNKLLRQLGIGKGGPPIVLVIDTFSDLMCSHFDTFQYLLAKTMDNWQKSNIHVIMCDSRPSPDVFTPLIQKLFPTKICFNVSSKIDSKRVINNLPGGEELRGAGDMLYLPPNLKKAIRIQAPYISEEEIKTMLKVKGE